MPLPPIISCFSKIQNGLPFWCRLTQAVLEKRPLNVYYYIFHCNYVSILHCFRDIITYFPKIQEVTWPNHAPSGLGCHSKTTNFIWYMFTKFEVSTFTHYEDTKGNAKCWYWGSFWWWGVTRGHRYPNHSTECYKVPIGYNGMPQIHPQNCQFPLGNLQPHLIHPYLDRSHSPSQMASRSNLLFFHNSPIGQTDRQTDRQMGQATGLYEHPRKLYWLYSDAANNENKQTQRCYVTEHYSTEIHNHHAHMWSI